MKQNDGTAGEGKVIAGTWQLLKWAIVALMCSLVAVSPAAAETPRGRDGNARSVRIRSRPPEFPVGRDVQGKIDFWKLIFTKYGENELVFHHREHPEIIYSVLDLSEYAETYSGRELAKMNSQAIEEEYDRVRALLRELLSGKRNPSPAERRLLQLFSQLPGKLSTNLQEAMEEDSLRYQRGIKERFRAGLIRSGRYLPAMERVFVEAGLPPELTRLPLIESSFDYTAYSSVGAAGIWQFMRGTGKRFLRITNAVDERRDPILATRAAARYLSEAYGRIQSWPLSVTSYNHGVSGILRAISATGTKDLDVIIQQYDGASFGFASKNFFPEFMAALEVEQNIDRYFPGLKKEDPWAYEEVSLGRATTMQEIVRFAGVDEEDIIRLNRAFMPPIVSGRTRIPAGYSVNIPLGGGRRLLAKLGRGEVLSVQNAVSPRSESPRTVARNDASTPMIVSRGNERPAAAADQSEREAPAIRADKQDSEEVLSLPSAERPLPADAARERSSGSEPTQTAALEPNGDSPITADSAASVGAGSNGARSNGMLSGSGAASNGQAEGGVTNTVPGAKDEGAYLGTSYTVRPGDTLPSIASAQRVSLHDLITANGIRDADALRAGQRLIIPNQRQAEPVSTPREAPPAKGERSAKGNKAARSQPAHGRTESHGAVAEKHYAVQKGDTLAGISKRLGMPLKRLKALNPRVRQPLRVGQELLVGGR